MIIYMYSEYISYEALLTAFCLFEFLLGVYWPSIALLRSREVHPASTTNKSCAMNTSLLTARLRSRQLSDAQRSSTMAVFRVLLNALVIGALLIIYIYI